MASNLKTDIRIKHTTFFFIVSSVLCFFFIRKYFILIFPFQILWGFVALKLKVTNFQKIYLLLLFILTSLSFLFSEMYYLNHIMSLVLITSVFVFFGSKPISSVKTTTSYSDDFFKVSSAILVFVNIVAFANYFFLTFNSSEILEIEDSFAGLYGKSGLGQHALSLINFIYAAYFLLKKKIWRFLLFFISGIFGFYGLGIVLLVVTVFIILLIKIKFIYKYLIYASVLLSLLFFILNTVSSRNLMYIFDNVDKTVNGFKMMDYNMEMRKAKELRWSGVPRKIVFFNGALKRVIKNPEIVFIGTGPGTYNSMTAFMFNGDYSRIGFLKKNINNIPKYHLEDVFPLWNKKIYGKRWMDGTRNQPFSSFFAILMEYGLILGGLFFLFFFKRIKFLLKRIDDKTDMYFVLFTSLFFGLTFFFLSTIEMVDIFFIYLLIIKTIEKDYVEE